LSTLNSELMLCLAHAQQSIYLLCKTTESPDYKGCMSRRTMCRWGLFLLGTNSRIVKGFSTLYIHEYFFYCLCIFRKLSIMHNFEMRVETTGKTVRKMTKNGVCRHAIRYVQCSSCVSMDDEWHLARLFTLRMCVGRRHTPPHIMAHGKVPTHMSSRRTHGTNDGCPRSTSIHGGMHGSGIYGYQHDGNAERVARTASS
jgi:hypothetical protein